VIEKLIARQRETIAGPATKVASRGAQVFGGDVRPVAFGEAERRHGLCATSDTSPVVVSLDRPTETSQFDSIPF
jgi:hypothetical protein